MLSEERIQELAWVARDAGPDVMLLVQESLRTASKEAIVNCAKLCDERAMKFEVKTAAAESEDDVADLRSRAWDFTVMASDLRKFAI